MFTSGALDKVQQTLCRSTLTSDPSFTDAHVMPAKNCLVARMMRLVLS